MSNAKVWINGTYIGERPYGYSSFSFDITESVKIGSQNTLAVRLENFPRSTRWYPGAGIYRNVRLVQKSQLHIPYCGIFVKTPRADSELGICEVETSIANFSKLKSAKIQTQILDKNEVIVASKIDTVNLQNSSKILQQLEVKSPKIWDIDSPNMYTVRTKIFSNNKEIDTCDTSFGFRKIEFDKDKGFFLNGRRVHLKGVCMHHDLGPLGAAVNKRATERQIQMLKSMGCTAIRTSHNPPSPEFLEICDSLGMLVMDEAFDEWEVRKCDNGYHRLWSKWAERDLTDFIKRDRNHPCVIMWSIGNEVPDQYNVARGAKNAKFLASIVHKNDPTRPATAAFNASEAALKNGLMGEVDIVGLNYKPDMYKRYRDALPNAIIYGSENVATSCSRGKYFSQ